jgi:hypothetical protein
MESVKNCQDFPVVFLVTSLVQDLMTYVRSWSMINTDFISILFSLTSEKTGRKSQHFFYIGEGSAFRPSRNFGPSLRPVPSKNFDPSPQPTGLRTGASIPRPFSYT